MGFCKQISYRKEINKKNKIENVNDIENNIKSRFTGQIITSCFILESHNKTSF